MDALRRALGAEQIDLLGASYGSFLGLTVLKNYSEGVRVAVLDSVVPLDGRVPRPEALDGSLRTLFAACKADAACGSAYPDLETSYVEALERVRSEPITIPLTSPGGATFEVQITDISLVSLTFLSMYSVDLIPVIPALLASLQAGDERLLAELVGQGAGAFANDEMTWGAAISLGADGAASEEEADLPAGLLPGMPLILDPINRFYDEVLPQWATYSPAQAPGGTNISDVPTLLLAGEYDPTTPVENAERAAQGLSQSLVLGVPATSHDTWASSSCVQSVIRSFLDNPDATPDTECFSDLALTFVTP